MRINNNLAAINTHRQYAINNAAIAKSTEKLSSGYRINRAGDDAAGLAISEKMRAQIRGLNMASKNSQDGISLIQTAEGALQETHNILQRMRELATQSASDTNDNAVDRAALDAEFQQLLKEVDDTAEKTKFNGMGVINGTFGATVTGGAVAGTLVSGPAIFSASDTLATHAAVTVKVATNGGVTIENAGGATVAQPATLTADYKKAGSHTIRFSDGSSMSYSLSKDLTGTDFADLATAFNGAANGVVFGVTQASPLTLQTGANQGDELAITIDKMSAASLGISSAKVTDRTNAANAITQTNTAINLVSTQRGKLGALQNRLNHKIANLDTSAENLQAAESRIRDIDMAKEMTNFTRNNILSQAATAMLAQANSAPQGVLQLLQ